MEHIRVAKSPHDLHDSISLADVAQKFIAHALALAGAADNAGDIDERNRGRYGFFGVIEIGELGEARVGEGDNTDIGLDGGKRIIGRQNVVLGERIKERGFSDVGEADDAEAEAHEFLLSINWAVFEAIFYLIPWGWPNRLE